MAVDWQVLLSGVPVSSNRGALGWSSVCLVRAEQRLLLFDTGSYGDRSLLLETLREQNVRPEEITDLFLSHFHYDHVLNYDLFDNAVVHLSAIEYDYVQNRGFKAAGDHYVPAMIFPALAGKMQVFTGRVEIAPGISTVPLGGHTPGLSGLLLENERVLIASDAIKNAHDFQFNKIPPVFGDPAQAAANYRLAANIADVIVPGHDSPFRIEAGGECRYLDRTDVEIAFSRTTNRLPEKIRLHVGTE